MPTNLLLLPLLGGYWFIHAFSYTRMRSQALDGYRLLLESAMAGVLFTVFARVVILLLNLFRPDVDRFWVTYVPDLPYLGTTSLAAVLGFVTAYPLNAFLRWTRLLTDKEAQRRAVVRYGNDVQRMLQEASGSERPISFTLDNRKSYIGLVVAAPSLAPSATHFSVIPFLSGYRDPQTLELVFTVDYIKAYDEKRLDPKEFRVVAAVANVRMMAFFDPNVYPSFVVEETAGAAS